HTPSSRETAGWGPAAHTLVVAEALGTNEFFAAGHETVGVHLLLRLTPPRDVTRGLPAPHTRLSQRARAARARASARRPWPRSPWTGRGGRVAARVEPLTRGAAAPPLPGPR